MMTNPGKTCDLAFRVLAGALTLVSLASLGFVVFFILREALPLFETVSPSDFLLGDNWLPVDVGAGSESFGIFNFICGTLTVSLLALAFAFLVSVGLALFLSCSAGGRVRELMLPCIDLLAGIPSVVYGFVGIVVVAKAFLELGSSTGVCVLAAAIVLAVMITPFLVSTITESMMAIRDAHGPASRSLGVDSWFLATHLVLPLAAPSFFPSLIMAFGRAMGETVAVMMVMGNANLFPTLLGKGETIASLIALEMGTAAVGSEHYHALFAAGLTLIVALLVVDGLASLLNHRLQMGKWN